MQYNSAYGEEERFKYDNNNTINRQQNNHSALEKLEDFDDNNNNRFNYKVNKIKEKKNKFTKYFFN